MPTAKPHPRLTLITPEATAQHGSIEQLVQDGLGNTPKHLSCVLFYDEVGSQLFEQICELPEYYVTRTERQILSDCVAELANGFDQPISLVELGSGSADKTRTLIEAFLKRHGALRYVPVDVSHTMLEASATALLNDFEGLEIVAIASEYHAALRQLRAETDRPTLIVWLGSSIGNFEPTEASKFLAKVRETMDPVDRLLVGFDMHKDRATLEAAYDDAQGVTAAFNRNVLERLKRELKADIRPSQFSHLSRYNEDERRIEMYLVSEQRQEITFPTIGLTVDFDDGETIHTENSYKYTPALISEIAGAAGLELERSWQDADKLFTVALFCSAKAGTG